MKKVTNYLFMFFMSATVLFVTSCGDDGEDPTPGNTAISFADTATIVAAPGDTVEFTVTAIGVDNIKVVSNPAVTFVGSNEVTSGTPVEVVIPITTAPGTSIVLTATAEGTTANAQKTILVAYNNIVDILTNDSEGRFTILAAAVQEAGLLATIQGATALTIFAPTNAAFEALGITADTDLSTFPNLADILQYHVVEGKILAGAVSEAGQEVPTLVVDRSIYAIRDGEEVRVNGVQITDADFVASNGVVHVIDKVLFPLSWGATLLAAPTTDQTSKTFFSTRTGVTYSVNDVTNSEAIISPYIDFGYGWGPENGPSLEAPDSYTRYNLQSEGWSTLNATKFRTTAVLAASFDEINPAVASDVSKEYEAGTAPTNAGQITGLEEGDVVAFTTQDGRFGLIKVVEIEPGFDSNDFMKIEVKVTN